MGFAKNPTYTYTRAGFAAGILPIPRSTKNPLILTLLLACCPIYFLLIERLYSSYLLLDSPSIIVSSTLLSSFALECI
jgi:hypothetical protein